MRKSDTKPFGLELDVKSAVPIYEQIKDAVRMAIFSGHLVEGDKVLSVRELAGRHSINPITIMKAYSQLEMEGLLYSRRGAGYFVKKDPGNFQQEKKKMLKTLITDFLKKISTLGFTIEDFLAELKLMTEEKTDD